MGPGPAGSEAVNIPLRHMLPRRPHIHSMCLAGTCHFLAQGLPRSAKVKTRVVFRFARASEATQHDAQGLATCDL